VKVKEKREFAGEILQRPALQTWKESNSGLMQVALYANIDADGKKQS